MAADDSSQYTPAAVAWTRGTLRLSFDAPLPVSLSTGAAVRVQVALRNEEGIAVDPHRLQDSLLGHTSELKVTAVHAAELRNAAATQPLPQLHVHTRPSPPCLDSAGSADFQVAFFLDSGSDTVHADATTQPIDIVLKVHLQCPATAVVPAESLAITVLVTAAPALPQKASDDSELQSLAAAKRQNHGGPQTVILDSVACTVRRHVYTTPEHTDLVVRSVESTALGGYFGVEWDSSVALARYLVASPQLVSGKHVLELGAGVGSLSALSSLLGASQVVATDLEGMMPLMRRTMRANGIACADSTAADDGNDAHAMVRHFSTSTPCHGPRDRVAPYKWGDPMAQFSLPFDIVLASDVLFDPAEWTALVDSFTASGAAMVLLAHRTRNAQERLFFDEWLRGAFTWRRLDSGASTAGSGGMELFELTRRAEHSSPPQRAW
eukprot:TRINITY_DN2274_c0_g1_i4.p1 TRINITY_DN2274_c0_g1~~TRINITY_DN2274_c0_g1_i4.p1  ORF type:complete len:450 (+),score=85.43 TRINITY_DN2274_c0_g1_i4:41-1351(+)